MFILCSLKKDNRLNIVDSTAVLSTCKEGQKVWDSLSLGRYLQSNLSYNSMSKTVFGRIFRCFGSFTSLIKSRLPLVLLHAGEQRCGIWSGTRPFRLSLLTVLWLPTWQCPTPASLALRSSSTSVSGGEHACRVLFCWAQWSAVPCVIPALPPPHQ